MIRWMVSSLLIGCSASPAPPPLLPSEGGHDVLRADPLNNPCSSDFDDGEDGVVDQHDDYTYDARGRQILDVETFLSGPTATIGTTYDNTDNVIAQTIDDGMLPPYVFIEDIYDSVGRELHFVWRDAPDHVTWDIANAEFNQAGLPTASVWTEGGDVGDEPVVSNHVITYDVDGRAIDDLGTYADGHTYDESWVYDDEARTITGTYVYSDSSSLMTRVSTFDEDLHLVDRVATQNYGDPSALPTVRHTVWSWEGDRLVSESSVRDGFPMSQTIYNFKCTP